MKSTTVLKQKLKKAVGRICSQTPREVAKRNHRNLIRRMGIISPRTFIGGHWMGRNELCYCDREPKIKFKSCCWAKHAVLPRDKKTLETALFVKKQLVYFNKHRRLVE